MPSELKFSVNGAERSVTSAPGRSLLEILREDLNLTGAKYGCGEGSCGACTVLVDGRATLSCTTMASEVAGKQVRTIEGLAEGDQLHPLQQAFLDATAYQCGYCTPGMIMAGVALLERTPQPDDEQIIEALDGHLCRCCGYVNIIDAVKRASARQSSRR